MAVQFGWLKSQYPGSKGMIKNQCIHWYSDLTPSPLSKTYTIKLTYDIRSVPKVYVIKPDLIRFEKEKLPHVYPKDRLCLYYPKYNEWHPNLLLIDTIVPWISEWLLHYEIWLSTGIWCGRGKHPGNKKV